MPAPRLAQLRGASGLLNYLYIPKSVVIYSPKLGFILLILRLYVVVFLLAEYLTDLSWTYAKVVPEGFVSYWASPNWDFYKQIARTEAQDSMCRDASEFKYHWHDQYFNPEGCIDLLPGDTWIKGDTSMFIPTYLQDSWIEQTAGPECAKLQRCCGSGEVPEGDLGGGYFCENHGWERGVFSALEGKNMKGEQLCQCEHASSYFVRGADGMKIVLHPSFVVEHGNGRLSGTTTNPSDNILVVVKKPHGRSDSTDEIVGEAKDAGDGGIALMELGGDGRVDHSEEAASHLGKAMMRRPRRSSSNQQGDNVLSVDDMRAAGQDVVEALQLGSAAVANTISDQADDLYEDITGSDDDIDPPIVRRDEAQTPRMRAPEIATDSWGSYLQKTITKTLYQQKEVHGDQNVTLIKSGVPLEMSLERWMEHATIVEGGGHNGGHPVPLVNASIPEGTFVLDRENKGIGENEIDGAKHRFAPYRVSGIELTLDLQWKNQAAHSYSDHNGTVLEIEVLARGGWHTTPQAYHIEPQDPVSGKAKMVVRRFSGVSIRFQSSGVFSHHSFVAVATALSAIVVYIGIPSLLINLFALNCLGNASSYYKMAARQVLDPKDMLMGMCARAVAFQKTLTGGTYTLDSIKDDLNNSFKVSTGRTEALAKANSQALAKLLILKYGDKANSITPDQLVDTALSDEPIHMDDAAPMYCQDSHVKLNLLSRIMEYLFVDNDDDDVRAANASAQAGATGSAAPSGGAGAGVGSSGAATEDAKTK